MSHPHNKHDRIVKGVKKGKRRAKMLTGQSTPEQIKIRLERLHRDTTKLCGDFCCSNPRKLSGDKTKQEKVAEQETIDIIEEEDEDNDEEIRCE